MAASKVKNLVILILLLVNVFLLVLVVPSRVRAGQQEKATAQQLSRLFEAYDIALSPETIPRGERLYDQQVSSAAEATILAVKELLGDGASAVQQRDGLHFESPRGEAVLVNGSLTAELRIPAGEPEAFTRDCLAKMGLAFSAVTVHAESETVTVCRVEPMVGGLPVVSTRLSFRYEDGFLTRVEGLLLTARDTMTVSGTQGCITAADALVEFLGSRLSTGWLGSRINSMEQGWSLTLGAGGSFSLRPVWRLNTDAGVCLVNGITGAVTLQ